MTPLSILVTFSVSGMVSWLAVGRALAYARSNAVLDVPSSRSAHTTPTPRGGGVGIVFTIMAALVAQSIRHGDGTLVAVALSVLFAAAVGFTDDRRSLPPLTKLALLTAAALIALPAATVRTAHVPYLGTVDLGVLAIPLSLVWLTGFSNAFNFMDGVNGIAALTALVSGLGFAVAGHLAGDEVTAFLGALTAGAALGFLPWNFPHARIFMGDSGSLPLGLLLAIVAARAARPVPPHGVPVLPFAASVLLLGPYVFDVTLTLISRALQGRRLTQAHSDHVYQRLARARGDHSVASLTFASFSAITSVLALVYGGLGDFGRVLCLVVPLVSLLGFSFFVRALERQKLK